MTDVPSASEMPPRLSLEGLTCRFEGSVAVSDLTLNVAPGEIVCLLGPSGCGKSTTLRMAAGVQRQTTGRVLVDDRIVSDHRRHVPPEDRSIGLMFQDFALFPHLSVADNIGFGLPRRASGRAGIIRDYLDRVGLTGYENRYPHVLSGGEQQRVALARALAPRPRIMLMDEPFSGLDNRLRDEVRDEALSILKEEGTSVLLVTHEPEEAMRMADRIALMRDGRIVQIGAPFELYNDPVDRDAAAFFSDINIVHGVVQDGDAETPFGRFQTPGLADDIDVEVIVRPQHLRVHIEGQPAPSVENGVAARGVVHRSRFVGAQSLIDVRMDHDGRNLRASVPHAFLPEAGTTLWLSMPRDRCFVFPSARQQAVATPLAAQ